MMRPIPSSGRQRIIRDIEAGGWRLCRSRRCSIEPVSTRDRPGPAAPRGDIPVVIGGFHVSGCLAMLPDLTGRHQGNAGDGRYAVCRRGRGAHGQAVAATPGTAQLQPLYNYMNDLPEHEGAPYPVPAARLRSGTAGLIRASMRGAAARSNVRSARSSTCRAASRATAPPTTSRRSSAPMSRRDLHASSSPTTTSPATRTGKRSSIG